jgi:hypothetical protein
MRRNVDKSLRAARNCLRGGAAEAARFKQAVVHTPPRPCPQDKCTLVQQGIQYHLLEHPSRREYVHWACTECGREVYEPVQLDEPEDRDE